MKKTLNNIYFFGDSICNNQHVNIDDGFVSKISKKLKKLKKNFTVTNCSVDGRTSRQALEDMPFQIQKHNPGFLYIQLGLNDCNFWDTDKGLPRVNLHSFKYNLIEIIKRGFKHGAKKIFLSTNHKTSLNKNGKYLTPASYEKNNSLYNEAIREVIEFFSNNLHLIDMENIFLKEIKHNKKILKKYLLPDGLHLSILGHELYYKNILKILKNEI